MKYYPGVRFLHKFYTRLAWTSTRILIILAVVRFDYNKLMCWVLHTNRVIFAIDYDADWDI